MGAEIDDYPAAVPGDPEPFAARLRGLISDSASWRRPGRPAAAAAVIALAAVLLPVITGVGVGSALGYLAYELGFVVLPGWCVYRALSGESASPIRQLAIGWALGYALEVLAFIACSALGVRGLFVFYPVAVVAATVAFARRRFAPSRTSVPPRRASVIAFAVLTLAAIGYFTVSFFPITPLPGSSTVTYLPDFSWAVSLAAEAKHHWPIEDPSVAGTAMPYHFFVNIHLAAASQVTGIALPTVYFRLFLTPLVVALVLQFAVAGQAMLRRSAIGLVAITLLLFVGELQLDPARGGVSNFPFGGIFFTLLSWSPSFLFGLVLMMPLIYLLGERLRARDQQGSAGYWALIGLLMIGASDAKVAILPLLVVALVLYASRQWLRSRTISWPALAGAGLAGSIVVALYVIQYRNVGNGVRIDPTSGFQFFENLYAVLLVRSELNTFLPDPLINLIVPLTLGVIGLFAAQLVGLAWLHRYGRRPLDSERQWLFSLLAASVLALLFLSAPGTVNSLYFAFYGLASGCLLAAEGLVRAWEHRPPLRPLRSRLATVAASWVLFVGVLIAIPSLLPLSEAAKYLLRYLGMATGLVALYVVGRHLGGARRWIAGAAVTGGLISVGALNVPFDSIAPAIRGTDRPTYASQGNLLTPDLNQALIWLKDNSPEDAEIAVNAPKVFAFDYAAFSERRVFLGGWGYSAPARAGRFEQILNGTFNPFAGRLELETNALAGDAAALSKLVGTYGVSYLLIDTVNGPTAGLKELRRECGVVFENDDAVILATQRVEGEQADLPPLPGAGGC